jgi:hypothetical protein
MIIAHSYEFKYDWSRKIQQNNERKRLAAHWYIINYECL